MSIVWSSTAYPHSMHSTQIRWRLGAEHAGWKFGWRDAPIAGDTGRRYVEAYCYAFAGRDFLEDDVQQLYWRTDIVQMTRYYMVEGRAAGSASHQLGQGSLSSAMLYAVRPPPAGGWRHLWTRDAGPQQLKQ